MLVIGSNKAPLLQLLPQKFLFIDDGSLTDELDFPRFDLDNHSFNPLRKMSETKADEFLDVLDAVFPQGQSTLTSRYSNQILFKALVQGKKLDRLLSPSKDPYERDAYEKIERLLLYPVLKNVLCRPPNLSFKGCLIARLHRRELGDKVARALGGFLINAYPGTIVVSDLAFYGTKSLLQRDLIAGINFLDERPDLKNDLLLMEKIGSHCTPDDAKILAQYAGKLPDTKGYSDFILDCIS